MQEIRLFMASLVQNFPVSVVPGTASPTREPDIGVCLSLEEFSVQLTVRDTPVKKHITIKHTPV